MKKPIQSIKRTLARQSSNPDSVRRLLNIWGPLLGAGIKIDSISDDWTHSVCTLNLRWWNRNMHGAAFGGALFSMTDVIFGTLINRYLGQEYEAWTRTGSFQYLKPGRRGARLEVKITPEMKEKVLKDIDTDGYSNLHYTSIIYNPDGEVVGIGHQDLHVRPRGGARRTSAPKQAETPQGYDLIALGTALAWQAFEHDTALLTSRLSAARRIPEPEDQIRFMVSEALEKGKISREDILRLRIPEQYLP